MKRALVIGASGGIGAAMCDVLAARGVEVVPVSRSVDGLDVTDAVSVEKVMGRLAGPFDLIFVAIGVLGVPEKSLGAIESKTMADVIAVNAIGPALILKEVPRLLAKDGICAVLSGAAIEIARSHKQSKIVALHPGTVATSFTAAYAARHKTLPADKAVENLIEVLTGLSPADTGKFFAYDGSEVPW